MIGPFIAVALQLAPYIISVVENVFLKPKSGDEKMSAAIAMLRELAVKMAANGHIARQPTDDELRGLIEGKFQELKSSGTITALVPPGEVKFFAVRGQIVELTDKK